LGADFTSDSDDVSVKSANNCFSERFGLRLLQERSDKRAKEKQMILFILVDFFLATNYKNLHELFYYDNNNIFIFQRFYKLLEFLLFFGI